MWCNTWKYSYLCYLLKNFTGQYTTYIIEIINAVCSCCFYWLLYCQPTLQSDTGLFLFSFFTGFYIGRSTLILIQVDIAVDAVASVNPLTHSLSRSLAHSANHPLTHSLAHPLAHSLTYLLTHSLTHSLTHLLARSLTHSLTHSLAHSLTHSLTHSRYMKVFVSSAVYS
jgi:hypothetical protein